MNNNLGYKLSKYSSPLNWFRRPMFKAEYKKVEPGLHYYQRTGSLFNKRSRKLGTY